MTAEQLEALSKAAMKGVETTGYKYFGDYELSEDQWAAVDALVEFARFVTEALRQGQLILVDDAAVERVKTALLARKFSDGGHLIGKRGHCSAEMIADDLTTAAIAAMGGK